MMMQPSQEELYRFDVAGFFIRTGVVPQGILPEIIKQVRDEPETVPSGPAQLLIDHPAVIGVVTELIGIAPRIEDVSVLYLSAQAQLVGELGWESPASYDEVLRYRVSGGRIRCAAVRVTFELSPIAVADRATLLLAGSHRAEIELPSELRGRGDDPLFTAYECPEGGAVIAAEGLLRYTPAWTASHPRAAISIVYAHPAVAYSRNIIRREVLESISKARQGYFRDPWQYDFSTNPILKMSSTGF